MDQSDMINESTIQNSMLERLENRRILEAIKNDFLKACEQFTYSFDDECTKDEKNKFAEESTRCFNEMGWPVHIEFGKHYEGDPPNIARYRVKFELDKMRDDQLLQLRDILEDDEKTPENYKKIRAVEREIERRFTPITSPQ